MILTRLHVIVADLWQQIQEYGMDIIQFYYNFEKCKQTAKISWLLIWDVKIVSLAKVDTWRERIWHDRVFWWYCQWLRSKSPKRTSIAKKTDLLDQFPVSPFLPVLNCTAIQLLLFLYPCLTNCLLQNLTCLHHNHGLGPDHLPCLIITIYKLSTHHIVKKNLYIEVYVNREHM